MLTAAEHSLKSASDSDSDARAAKALLDAIDTVNSGASKPAVETALSTVDVALRGNALAVAESNKEDAKGVQDPMQKFYAIKESLSAFSTACAKVGEEKTMALSGRQRWEKAADWARAEMKSLGTLAVEKRTLEVKAALANFNPGGKSEALGGSYNISSTVQPTNISAIDF